MIRRLVFLGALLQLACPEVKEAGPVTVCTKAYDKCKLPDGPLGVCDRRSCPPGHAEPCFVCVSQH